VKKFFILVLLLICWPSITAGAQEQVPEEAKVLEEVVITATGTEVSAKETSVSSTVITEKEIKARQVTRVEKMLRSVPGVTMVQSGSRGGETSLFIRGSNSNMNQVLLNGIKLNQVGGFFDFSNLTVDNVERIEVIRGPMSALYGNDAMTGVVNVMTRKGRGKPTLSLTSLWGGHAEGHSSNNLIMEQKASLEGSYKQFAYSSAYSRIDDTGILAFNNHFASHVLNNRFDFDPLENLSFTFTNLVVDSYFDFPTSSGDRFDPKSLGGNGLDPNQNNTNLNLVFGLTGNYWPTTWWENELTLSYVRLDANYNNPANPAEVAFQTTDYFSRDLENHYTLKYHSNFRFGDEARIGSITTLGLELRADQWKGWSYGFDWNLFAMNSTHNKARRGSTAWYAQEQLALWNRLFLTAGGRVEDNRAFSKLEFCPRASAALRFPETNTTIRAAGGRSVKAPSFLATNSLNPFFLGNSDLMPEKNNSWEVGFDQWFWKDRLSFSATYFENHFTDLIQWAQTSWTTGSWFNIAAARTKGFELALQTQPLEGLTARAAYTYLTELKVLDDGGLVSINIISGQNLLRRPRQTFSLDLGYIWDRLETHLNGLYVGPRADRRPDPNPPYYARRLTNGGYFICNLAASYDILRNWNNVKKVQVMARVNNLFDKHYNEIFGYSSPRFNIIGGLRFVFQ